MADDAAASAAAAAADDGSPSAHAPDAGVNDYSRFDKMDETSSDEEGEVGGKKKKKTEENVGKESAVPVADRLFQAGSAKTAGNGHIKEGEAGPAATQYRKGIKVLEDMSKASKDALSDGISDSPAIVKPTQEVEAHELSLSLHLNLAMAEIKLKNFHAAIKAASDALGLDGMNIKALFRRGQAHRLSGNLAEAKADLSQLLGHDPSNGAAKKELAAVVKKAKESKAKEKKGFANLFERAGGVYDDLEEQRKKKAELAAAEEAKLKAEWEAEMATKEAQWKVEKAERDAAEAAEEAKKAAEKKAAGEAEEEEEHEKDIKDFVQKKAEDWSDSDDEPDPLLVFVKTPFAEWKKKREEAAKKEKEAKEKEDEKKKRAARDARRAEQKVTEKDQAEVDEEDAKMLAEISKKGYCHHARKLDENEVITEITPQKLSDNDGDGGGGGGGGGKSAWAPQSVGSSSSSSSSLSSSSPQRIDSAGSGGGGGSAWNKNGTTWEERDCSEWARECAKRCIKQAAHSSGTDDIRNTPENVVGMLDKLDMKNSAGNEDDQLAKIGELASMLAKVTARVTKVSKVEGDASVAVVRGKKRYLFDLTADVDYEVHIDESFGMDVSAEDTNPARQAKYKGKFSIREISHDAVNDGEVEVGAAKPSKGSSPPKHHQARVKSAIEGLKADILKRCLSLFVTEFQSSQ